MSTRKDTIERMVKEMLMAGASGRRGWCHEAEMVRRRRMAIVRDVVTVIAAVMVFTLFLWAAARGLDSEGGWSVGDYAKVPSWNDEEAEK